jgi:hypothetical protein
MVDLELSRSALAALGAQRGSIVPRRPQRRAAAAGGDEQ